MHFKSIIFQIESVDREKLYICTERKSANNSKEKVMRSRSLRNAVSRALRHELVN